MAKTTIDEFIGFTVYYSINTSDFAGQKRKALFGAVYNETVEDDGTVPMGAAIGNMQDEWDALERQIRAGVE